MQDAVLAAYDEAAKAQQEEENSQDQENESHTLEVDYEEE